MGESGAAAATLYSCGGRGDEYSKPSSDYAQGGTHFSLLALLEICSLEPWKDIVRILGVRRYRVFQVFLDPFADAILLLLAYTGLPYTAEAEHNVKRTLKFASGSITWAPRFSRKAVRVLASVHRGR